MVEWEGMGLDFLVAHLPGAATVYPDSPARQLSPTGTTEEVALPAAARRPVLGMDMTAAYPAMGWIDPLLSAADRAEGRDARGHA